MNGTLFASGRGHRFLVHLMLAAVLFVAAGCSSNADYKRARDLFHTGQLDQAEALLLELMQSSERSIRSHLPLCEPVQVKAATLFMLSREERTSGVGRHEKQQRIDILLVNSEDLISVVTRFPDQKKYRQKVSSYLADIGWRYCDLQQYDQARTLFKQAEQIFADPDVLYALGLLAWLNHDRDSAIRWFHQVLAQDRNHIRSREMLAQIQR